MEILTFFVNFQLNQIRNRPVQIKKMKAGIFSQKRQHCIWQRQDLVVYLDLLRKEIPVRLKTQQRQNTNEIKNESEDRNS